MLGIDITNSGGGSWILLNLLVKSLPSNTFDTVKSRLKFFGLEWLIRDIILLLRPYSRVLYFSNIGPLLPFKRHVAIVFIQNVLLVKGKGELKGLVTVRYRILRVMFKIGLHQADLILVQSQFLKIELIELHKISEKKIKVVPFFEEIERSRVKEINSSIFYPSGYGKHKGFELLAKLWKKNKSLPILKVCLDNESFQNVFKGIERVENLGVLSRKEMLNEISNCTLIVYPSRFESLGLGLLEAIQLDKKVVVYKTDYSLEFVSGVEYFDGTLESLQIAIQKILSNNSVSTSLKIENNLDNFISLILDEPNHTKLK